MAEDTSYLITNQLRLTLQDLCKKGSVASLGYIHSFNLGTECYLLSCSALAEGEKPGTLYDTVALSLPTGIYVTGLYLLTENASDSTTVEKKFRKQLSALIKVLPEETPNALLIVEVTDPRNGIAFYEYDTEDYKLTSLSCSNTDCDILNNCLIARLQANLPLTVEYTDGKAKLCNDLFAEIERWKEELMCQTTAFHIENSDVLLFTGEDSNLDHVVGDMIERIHRDDDDDDENGFSKKSKKKVTSYSNLVMHLRMLCQRTDSDTLNSSVAHAPLIQHKHGSFTNAKINLPIDIVAYVHPNMSTMFLANSLIISICNQLNALRDVITPNKMENMLHTAVPYHFKPATLGHVITVIYPEDKTEDELESVRKRFHAIFHLPSDMPQVRRLNSFIFPNEKLPGGCLVNPHIGLPASGVTGGRVSLVHGQYAYHHYMQDHMDDNGWGCAYRSLQTLVSWFRLQGYTDKPVPTHREIQKILVEIGDKESNFINSKKWIGSTEVSFVLDHLLGVTSKILHVDSGAELETKARDLAVHFDTQGTPIMIGGGVLAHTILGVHFNETTGAVKFLILDPHYTGGEDLRIIQDKGWCGWKDTTFWDKNAYYNLCMPQRPPMI